MAALIPYTRQDVLADWEPILSRQAADCVVSDGMSVQAAIDDAIRMHAASAMSKRYVIEIAEGLYDGPVYVPKSAPPLTLRGAGHARTTISARIDAQMTGREYELRFAAMFQDRHHSIRNVVKGICARETIGTFNSGVVRVERDDVQIADLTIRNDYACDRVSAAPDGEAPDAHGRFAQGQHQAVACHIADADRVALFGVHAISFQDTLYLQCKGSVGRACLTNCLISGDVDFVFGGGTAWFEECEIKSRGERGAQSWAVAPSTSINRRFGFVFQDCRFTHDGFEAGRTRSSFLGRQWFEGVRATPYGKPLIEGYVCAASDVNRFDPPAGQINRTTLEAVGKCTLQNSTIGTHIDAKSPWDHWGGPDWTPRFRPVQTCGADFIRNLKPWLIENDLDYSALDTDEPWLLISGT